MGSCTLDPCGESRASTESHRVGDTHTESATTAFDVTGSITIVTGCPGSGKTTLATRLSQSRPHGVHLSGDVFYQFIAHPISPILAESHAQNTVVTRAIARAARIFASGDYEVFVDGVVGPWFLPTFVKELEDVPVLIHYVVVRASFEDTLRRATSRPSPADEQIVRHMYDQFASLGPLEGHTIDSTGQTEEETFNFLARRWLAGEFALDLGSII